MSVFDKYNKLDQGGRIQALYIWIDGTGEDIRCKTKTLDKLPNSVEELPIWNFDGSSTYQAEGHNSDVYLHPVAIFKDPFRGGDNILVLCETYAHDHKPNHTNHRKSCNNLMNDPEVKVSFCVWVLVVMLTTARRFKAMLFQIVTHSKNYRKTPLIFFILREPI